MKSRRAISLHAHHLPWNSAGNLADNDLTADDVVRETGWVFNNETGDELTLKTFVETGDKEVQRYIRLLQLESFRFEDSTLLEIGSGIGRMTSSFTNRCNAVIAADVDSAFLERCRQTVARFGRIDRLSTLHVADGKTLGRHDDSVDMTFSYITLQHCQPQDALSLVSEAIRVTRSGGLVVLNFRTWVRSDIALVPLGIAVRRLWKMPILGRRLARWRWSTRLGWQANRLKPDIVLENFKSQLSDIKVFHSVKRKMSVADALNKTLKTVPTKRINPSHWWLVAQVS
ncbi:MAG: class I SAM-dependent methyltransferase [Actinomycetota bacterium]|nr:class I SAM-dependent methyltransferase [Actinomycetota bacterium]MDA3004229.1 class I SAM-dependent methyltransferase [Actinomycetota bacterium]